MVKVLLVLLLLLLLFLLLPLLLMLSLLLSLFLPALFLFILLLMLLLLLSLLLLFKLLFLFLSIGGFNNVDGAVVEFCCGDGVIDDGLCLLAEKGTLSVRSADICGVSGEIFCGDVEVKLFGVGFMKSSKGLSNNVLLSDSLPDSQYTALVSLSTLLQINLLKMLKSSFNLDNSVFTPFSFNFFTSPSMFSFPFSSSFLSATFNLFFNFWFSVRKKLRSS